MDCSLLVNEEVFCAYPLVVTVIQLFLLLTAMIPFPTSNTPLPTKNDEYSMLMRFFGLPSFFT